MGNILKIWKSENNKEFLLPNSHKDAYFMSDDIFNSIVIQSSLPQTNNISNNSTECDLNKMRSQIIILANGYNNLETKLNNIISQYELLIGKLQMNNSKINERMNAMTVDMESLLSNDKILVENVENLKANFEKLLEN